MLCQKVNRKSKLIFQFLKYLNNVTLALDDTYAILNAGVVIEYASFVVGVDVDPDYLDVDVGVDVGVTELFIDLNFS